MNLLLFETVQGEAYPVLGRGPAALAPEIAGEEASWWLRTRARVHSSYRRLKAQFDHRERACAMLRHADRLLVAHAEAISSAEAEKKLHRFFKLRYSKHGRWLVADSLLAGAGSVLTPLPGPNIFFFYPAVRALAHYFARDGAGKALRLEATFKPEPLIDRVQAHVDRLEAVADAVAELERQYDVDGLRDQLKHVKAR